ncbi:hypothetical protein D9611_005183 [Ephemerocybe angulata]|uniref:Homeobox domain-containing protein n=1 Tax=Ephemerocybe angulata TaxID=980116 RepID=A0A8H5C0H3_9AGAR|nr:hypothetical protein D9611_005183 [Tulosesus angulatus]
MDAVSSLSRTDSAASFSSSDEITPSAINASRRTRKRFTNAQLTMLETLFHRNSHPSREEREAVAKAGQMEIKSVTIWFQNKRQTERKSAANKESSANSRTVSPTFSSGTSSRCSSALGSRPSLDRVASRTELRNPTHSHTPHTPTRRHTTSEGMGSNHIWDHMPSSPLVPASPAGSEYLDYTKQARSKRTLEWACAAARISDKGDGHTSSSSSAPHPRAHHSHHHHHHHHHHPHHHHLPAPSPPASTAYRHRTVHRQKYEPGSQPDVTPKGTPMDLELTDDESDEAITPPSTWGREDPRWGGSGARPGHGDVEGKNASAKPYSSSHHPMVVEDDDMMKAALALCGLGGRRPL